MNCAKCLRVTRRGVKPLQIKLASTGLVWQGDELFQCPQCRSKFWFSIVTTKPTPCLPIKT